MTSSSQSWPPHWRPPSEDHSNHIERRLVILEIEVERLREQAEEDAASCKAEAKRLADRQTWHERIMQWLAAAALGTLASKGQSITPEIADLLLGAAKRLIASGP